MKLTEQYEALQPLDMSLSDFKVWFTTHEKFLDYELDFVNGKGGLPLAVKHPIKGLVLIADDDYTFNDIQQHNGSDLA